MSNPIIRIKSTGQLTEIERQLIQDLYRHVFGNAVEDFVWAEVDWVILIFLQDELASQVEIIERTVQVGGREVRVGGIGGVGTLRKFRRQGYASLALRQAERFMCETLNVSFGLLITSEKLAPFYQSLGWHLIEDEVVFDQPNGKVKLDGAAMYLPIKETEWPAGKVDFCGYPW